LKERKLGLTNPRLRGKGVKRDGEPGLRSHAGERDGRLGEPELGLRVWRILDDYFHKTTSPGLLVYEESLIADRPLDRDARREVRDEVERAHRLMLALHPAGNR